MLMWCDHLGLRRFLWDMISCVSVVSRKQYAYVWCYPWVVVDSNLQHISNNSNRSVITYQNVEPTDLSSNLTRDTVSSHGCRYILLVLNPDLLSTVFNYLQCKHIFHQKWWSIRSRKYKWIDILFDNHLVKYVDVMFWPSFCHKPFL